MAEAFAVIEEGNHLRHYHEQPHLGGIRLRQGPIFGEFRGEKLKQSCRLGRVRHRIGTRRHGEAFDAHRVARIVIDDERDAVIPGDIGGLLALPAA